MCTHHASSISDFVFSKKIFGLSRLKLSQFAHKFFIYHTRLLLGGENYYRLILLPLFKSQPLIEPSIVVASRNDKSRTVCACMKCASLCLFDNGVQHFFPLFLPIRK